MRIAPSGGEWLGSQSGQCTAELILPGTTPWQMQSELARRAGEPSGEGEEASPQGLGSYQLLAQTDVRCPAGQVVGHHLDGQPGSVGGEASRGEMVQPDAVFEVAYRVFDLGVAAVVRLQFQGVAFPVGPCSVRAGPSAHLRCLQPRPATGDSPADRCSRGGGHPPWPDRSNVIPVSGLCRGD